MDASDRSENHPRNEEQTDTASMNAQENDAKNSETHHENNSTDDVLVSTQQLEESSESSDDWSEEDESDGISEDHKEMIRNCLRRANIIRDFDDVLDKEERLGTKDPWDERFKNPSETSGGSSIDELFVIFRDPKNIKEAVKQLRIYDKELEKRRAQRAASKVDSAVAPQASLNDWLREKIEFVTVLSPKEFEKVHLRSPKKIRRGICEKHLQELRNKTSS